MKVSVDRDVCQGYGNCVLADGATFDLDDDGLVVLLRDAVGPDGQEAVKRAVYDCPTNAITLVEE